MKVHLILIEPDQRLRASVSIAFTPSAYLVPLEKPEDLMVSWPSDDVVILARDADGTMQAILDMMESRGTWLPIMLYSFEPELTKITAGFEAGALGYFGLPFNPAVDLVEIRRLIARNETLIERRRRRAEARNLLRKLSPRERQVAHELSAGASNKEIARILKLSPRTVEIHRSNMIQKLAARNSAEAIRLMTAAS